MALFEIDQRFKGHFLKELRISFNINDGCKCYSNGTPKKFLVATLIKHAKLQVRIS